MVHNVLSASLATCFVLSSLVLVPLWCKGYRRSTVGKRHDPDSFNAKTAASEYSAAAKRQETREWLAGQHGTGTGTGYERAAQGLQLDAQRTS